MPTGQSLGLSLARLFGAPMPGVPAAELAGVLAAPSSAGGPAGQQVVESYEPRAVASETSGATGVATVRFGPVPAGRVWLVQRYLVHVENDPGSVASVYVGSPATVNLVDGTSKGDLDVGSGDPPLIVPGGQVLTFQWAAAGVGNECLATVSYWVARLEG